MKDFRKEPLTFMLYLGLLGSVILFLFIFFIFALKEFRNQSIEIEIPAAFYFSTVILLLSSLMLYLSRNALENEKFKIYRTYLGVGYILGLAFIDTQLLGWQVLWSTGVKMSNSTAGSFLYLLSGLHLAHTLAGLVAYSKLVADAFYNIEYVNAWVYSVDPSMKLRVKLISIYWHFLDVLWLLVFFFLLYQSYAS